MRYIIVSLLLLNIGYFGWNLLRPPAPPAAAEAQARPPRVEGIQLVSEAREAETARRIAEAEQVCFYVSGFSDIFQASEFAAGVIGDGLEATVYVAQDGENAEVRLQRHVEDLASIPQWPDFAGKSGELTGMENPCQTFAHADHFH